jgi:hypothetical protein
MLVHNTVVEKLTTAVYLMNYQTVCTQDKQAVGNHVQNSHGMFCTVTASSSDLTVHVALCTLSTASLYFKYSVTYVKC